MFKTIRGKIFSSIIMIVAIAFILIYALQNILIVGLFINSRHNTTIQHMVKAMNYIEETESLNLSDELKDEISNDKKYKRLYIQLYNDKWEPQLTWFNPQLLSPYYVEMDGLFYRLLVDKYTNMIYKKELLVSSLNKNYIRIKIQSNAINDMKFEDIWQFDGTELIYIIPNGGNSITLKSMYKSEDNFDIPSNHTSDIIEDKGVLISQQYQNTIDVGYGYIRKFMNEQSQSYLVNNEDFPKNQITSIETKDSYTGIPYGVDIKPLQVNNNNYYLVYVSFNDDAKYLTPFDNDDLIITFIALLISAAIAYLYSGEITAPILEIRGVTSALSKLDFSAKCTINTHDEIEGLAEDINLMAHELELKTNQLNEEIIKMKKLEEYRKDFIAISSHEFRTPLTIMRGILEGLEDKVYDINDKGPLNIMKFEVEELETIVHELLTITKSEANIMEYHPTHFQLVDIVQLNLNRYKYILIDRGINIVKNLEDGFIIGDEDKISLVVKNVISNAIKYSRKNATINISIIRESKKISLYIENEGGKIDESLKDELWEPFKRTSKNKDKIPGFGIGLYTTKLILTAHDSDFSLYNTDRGVCFKASFELLDPDE